MPKLKPSEEEEGRRVVRAAINENSELYGIDDKYLMAKLGMGYQTFRKRLESPETFTLGEIRILAEVLKLTPVQAAGIVRGRPITSKEVREFILL